MKVSRETLIGQILMMAPEAAPILMRSGMHCIGCPSAQGESLEEACMVHGIAVDPVVEAINEFLANKGE